MNNQTAQCERTTLAHESVSTSGSPLCSLPSPFYDRDGITIYHGRCEAIAPRIQCSSIVTDPPYGIDFTQRTTGRKIEGDAEPFDPRWMLAVGVPCVLWGANHFADKLPSGGRWLFWLKRAVEIAAPKSYGDGEIAWCSEPGHVKAIRHISDGCIREGSEHGIRRRHPSQKPLKVMNWCMGFVTLGECVLDPYMGSGTTLVAAKLAGVRAVGIECELEHCETAVDRLRQGVLF